MWLFREKKTRIIDDGRESISDKVAGKIAGICMRFQKSFAMRMNKSVGAMSGKRLKVILVFFCLLTGGYSLYLVVNALTAPAKGAAFKIDQVKVPEHFDKTGNEMITPETYVDKYTFGEIQIFKKSMDSLRAANPSLYDSIMTARPFLMDSVLALEQLYYSQNQK